MTQLQQDYNFRSSISGEQINYIASLRDGALFALYGVDVEIKIPNVENNLDEYINYVDEDFTTTNEIVAPQFNEYRQIISNLGNDAEEHYPLEIVIPTTLHLPRNSRIILDEYAAIGNKVAKEWRVLSTEMKQLSNSKTYSKIAHCTPDRTSIYVTNEKASCVCEVSTGIVSNYQIIESLQAYSSNYGTATITNSAIIDNINNSASVACTVSGTVRLPSILY